jgi:hypothetical protein
MMFRIVPRQTVFIVLIPAPAAAVVGVVIVVVGGAGGFEFVVFSAVLKVIPYALYSS